MATMPTPDASDPNRSTAPTPGSSPTGPDLTETFPQAGPAGSEETASYESARTTEPTAAGSPPALGSVCVPGYEIEGVLGRGGMGVVYKARHLALKRTVALKMVLAGGHAGATQLARFKIEAEAVARLQHPNIVQIHEVGVAGGHPYCALEFVEGGSLADRINGKPLPPRESARVIEALARAMQLVHSRNVIHRDLKPANILLSADGMAKISDFGLARQLDSDSGETQMGAVMGTPSYMAPEQAAGRTHEAGPAADVYALGAILYACLTGRPPFKGPTMVETLDQVRNQEPVRPSHWQASVPLDLETICLKCLRKEPEKRYASAAELADDLLRYQRGEPILARPVGGVERALKWVRRNKVVTGAALAVLLALVLGATMIYLKYLDAERQRGFAEDRRNDADQQKRIADARRTKAEKAREFLASIFRISETGNVTAKHILASAEKRIPVEFADQPELREELLAAIAKVRRGIARRIPRAMILEMSGTVQLKSAAGANKKAEPQTLVNLDDRLSLGADGQVQLVFLSDLHTERIKPGREVTVEETGCEPPDAALERETSILMSFVPLPKGTFYKGWNGRPQSGVKTEISKDFEIAVHDVTQGQWQALMGNNPSYFSRTGVGKEAVVDIADEELKLFPVENVSWDETQEFIKKLNEKERGRGYWYRLPSEAEWEYACRGGATSEQECSFAFYFAKPTNALSSQQANINGNYPYGKAAKGEFLHRTTRVGAYPSNKLGLCDMHGNVIQWCADAFQQGPETLRVYRGSCYFFGGEDSHAAGRPYTLFTKKPSERMNFIGFRLARVRYSGEGPPPVEQVPVASKPAPTSSPAAILEQARSHAGRRKWQQAAQAYAAIIDGPVPDSFGHVAFEYAAVLLLAGDEPGYKKVCTRLVNRCGQPGVRSYHVARACSLAPESFSPADRPGELARLELSRAGNAFWSLWLQGALHYRAARYADAQTLLQKTRDDRTTPPDAVAGTRIWLALTYHRLNKPAEARGEFEQAEKWLKQFPDGIPPDSEKRLRLHLHNWLEVHVLRLEATPFFRPDPMKDK
jgi:formylglycine-generating enzyme required for sulfatase activity